MANEFVARKGLIVSGSAVISGSVTSSIGFLGNLTGTSSFAASASAATSLTFNPVSSSYALSSSYAMSASWAPGSSGGDFNTLVNKPTLVSSSAQINTGSFTGSFTGGLLGTASFATTTWTSVNNIPVGLFSSSAQLPAGTVSSSLQFGTGSYTGTFIGNHIGIHSGTFTGSLVGSASYASTNWIDVASKPVGLFSSSVQLPTGIVSSSIQINTGSFTGSFTGAFQGLGSGITGVVSSSYALSSSFAMSASWAPGSAGGDFNTLVNKPTLVSSSAQINTGSFTGSFTGNLLGSVTSASYAATASSANDFRVRGQFLSYGAGQISSNVSIGTNALSSNTNGLNNTAIGNNTLLSNTEGASNLALGAGALTSNTSGSYNIGIGVNVLAGNISADGNIGIGRNALGPTNKSYNVAIGHQAMPANVSGTSNLALGYQVLLANTSGSYNTALGYTALGTNVSGNTNIAIGYFAGYYETGSDTFYIDNQTRGGLYQQQTASLLYGTFNNNPVLQTLRINAALTASQNMFAAAGITGSLLGSSSYALSSSYAMSASWAPGGGQADFNTLLNKPTLVSSSAQVNTGSFTGSFTGGLLGSASFATTTWTSVNNIPVGLFSSSAQLPIGIVSSSAQVNTGSFTGSFTGGLKGSASYAPTSWIDINNKPIGIFSSSIQLPTGIVSSSVQINTGSFTGSLTGSLQGSSSYALSSSYAMSASWAPSSPSVSASYALTASYATVAQSVLGSISSASWAAFAVTASYVTGGLNFPNGLIVTGSITSSVAYTGSVTGNLLGTATTASYITGTIGFPSGLIVTGSVTASQGYFGTASWAYSASNAVSAAWAPGGGTADYTQLINVPVGIVSSSTQVNTGSFTGSFTGAYSISYLTYDRATVKTQVMAAPTAGNYTASVTLSLGQHIYMTGSGAIGNTYWRVADEDYARADGFILTIASGGIRTHTWPVGNAIVSTSWPGGVSPTLTPSGGFDTIVFTTLPNSRWAGVLSVRDSR